MADSDDALERRIAAVERAVDGEAATDRTDPPVDSEDLESRIADLETRVDELDAALQAVRGFLGGVSAVNESVERRADAAVAAVDRLERRLDEDGAPVPTEAHDRVTQSTGDDGGGIETDGGAGDSDGGSPIADPSSNDDADDRQLRDRLRDLQ
ncbi:MULTISPECIES: DUF7310 family coiled-coil domain-containing protein [Halolamina]|uniref:DUF7310 domain-containing protein n=1 Tax=Halolamina pelagica TaxID=699431 RepID=A0A1I5R2D1_9EURY|nr:MULTISPECIES: hypothetical protein [Halolamina]NHX35649.1 hypothetical protein [Halolamina sp. R1-12]SFP52497.1 hypothetical protein SAMN05216277_104199 [Halolamina pelagica]